MFIGYINRNTMSKIKLVQVILFSAFLFGCQPAPRYGTITDVYSEIRISHSNGTTIVKHDDGRIFKYCGKLGKKGEKIRVDNLNPLY